MKQKLVPLQRHLISWGMAKVLKLVIRNSIYISCFMFFCACYNPIDDISDIFGTNIKESVCMKTMKREESCGLNSDFTCVYVYSIKDSDIIIRAKELFQPYEFTSTDTNDIIYLYLNNTSGYYQTLFSDEDVKRLYIDTVNNIVIYCISHL